MYQLFPLGHSSRDCQLNELRAAEEVCQLEMARIEDEAKAEVMEAKKDLKTLSRRMKEGCTREVI